VIVTSNLKDFVPLPEGLEAQSPDDFLLDQRLALVKVKVMFAICISN
jgi:hypothetical protein